MTQGTSTEQQLFPQWLHEHQVQSLTESIERETRQRAELVKWLARIDEDVLRWTAERAVHQAKLDHGIYTKPEAADG